MSAKLPDKNLDWPICWEAVSLIAESEGCRLKAYKDIAGVWTIGWGHTGGVKTGDVWTQAEADRRFCEELTQFANQIRPLFQSYVHPVALGACVSLAYNIGIAAFKGSSVLRLHNAGNYEAAAGAFKLWNKATIGGKKQVVRGLALRREKEAGLYQSVIGPNAEEISSIPHDIPDAAPDCERSVLRSSTMQGGAVATAASTLAMVSEAASQMASIEQSVGLFPPWLKLSLLLSAMVAGGVVCWRIYKRKQEGKS